MATHAGVTKSAFALPAVQAVISFKWSAFAQYFLAAELLLYVSWLTLHCAFSLLLVSGLGSVHRDDCAATAV